MSDEMQDPTENQPTTQGEPAPEEPKARAISLEIEDLSEEGRQRLAKQQGRPIQDLPYRLLSQESRPGSVLALQVEMDRQLFIDEQERLLRDIAKDVALPGFRKGKAPLKLLQLRLGPDAVRDTIASLATNVLRQENAKQSFKLISKPQVQQFEADAADKPFSFEVELEVEPVVELKQYTGITVQAPESPVTDEMVDQRLEQMRHRNAVTEPADADAVYNEGDSATVDIEVLNEAGERLEHLCKEATPLYDPARQLPPAIAEQIVGKKAGEPIEARVTNTTTNRRGEEITHEDLYRVTIREIRVQKLPQLDDEFAKDLGEHETLADLRAAIRGELEKEMEERHRGAAIASLYHDLIKLNPIDAPASFLAKAQYDMIMEDSYQLQQVGLRLEQVVQDTGKYLEDQRAGAETRVKANMILQAISAQEKMEVTDEDVEAEIAKLAESSGRKPLAVRARLEAQNQLAAFADQIMQRKINDFLLEKNTIQKTPAETPAGEDQ